MEDATESILNTDGNPKENPGMTGDNGFVELWNELHKHKSFLVHPL